MKRLGIQAALAFTVAALITTTAAAQNPNSILQRTYSILVPADASSKLRPPSLPSANLQRGRLLQNQRAINQPRRFSPELESVLAPPSNPAAYPTQRIPTQNPDLSPIGNRALRHSSPAQYNPTYNSPSVNSNPGYGTNPYATSEQPAIRQVSNRDIIGGWPVTPEKPKQRIPDPFAEIKVSDFPDIGSPVPLDSLQDPEDPSRQVQETAPRVVEPAPRNQAVSSQETDQQETEPRSLPGDSTPPTQLPVTPQEIDQQETEPRSLPGDSTPPTQLPVPPRDSNSNPPNQTNNPKPPIDGGTPIGQKPFVYSNEAYPGRQTYPGVTSQHARPQTQGNLAPSNPNQIIYQPREKQAVLPQLPISPPQQNYGYPYGQINPATGLPIELAPTYHGNYRQVVEPPPIPPTSFQEADGWRPQMVIGEQRPSAACDDASFQPLFYLAGFGGLNNAEDLGNGIPSVGSTLAKYNLDNGSNFGIAFGQYQGQNLRTEIEYTYRQNDIESIGLTENTGAGLNLTSFNLAGDIKAHSGMTNVIWQFSNPTGRWVNPYVGAGVGFVFMDVNATRGGQNVLVDGQDGNSSFAYQLFAGLNTQLSNEMDVFVEYRYFAADQLRLQTNLSNVNGGAGFLTNNFDFETNNINFGIRYKF